MRFGSRLIRRVAPLAAGGVLMAVFACTSGDHDSDSSRAATILSECEYADQVSTKLALFSTSTLSVLQSGGATDMTQALDRLDSELAAMAKELGALKSTKEVNTVNQSLVAGVEQLRNQLPEAKTAAEAGDAAMVAATIDKAIKDFGAKVEQSEKEHAELSSRLTQCSS